MTETDYLQRTLFENVAARCQFCNALYRFDTEDLVALDATLDAARSRSLH